MMQPQTVHNHNSYTTITQSLRPCFISGNNGSFTNIPANSPAINFTKKVKKNNVIGTSRRKNPRTAVKAIFETETESEISTEPTTEVKVTVTVTPALGGVMGALTKGLDDLTDAFGKGVLLELVAAELDPKSGEEKETLKAFAKLGHFSAELVEYHAEFEVSDDFGIVGGILVENEHHTEMFINDIVLDGSKFTADPITFSCQSWVSPKDKRILFSTKSYVPSETPNGLMKYRKKELEILRGDGTGERKKRDRIYDYDVYNDLGDPDANEITLSRPIFGGNKTFPYPRRCRTGRPKTKTDPMTESRSRNVYVPRDEMFSAVKDAQFSANTFFSVMHVIAPSIKVALKDKDMGFLHFANIDSLFSEGIHLANINKSMMDVIPAIIKAVEDTKNHVLLFETPKFLDRDKFGWMRDVEFSRQTLAGLNPCNITLVTEWPPKSKLDPEVYGPAESAITTEFIENQIKGFVTLDEALKQKRLFMIDYHDILLPFVQKVRSQKGTTLYGSRVMFFLTPESETLMPVAIELVRPPMDGKPQWKEVYKPCWTGTGAWLWKLAKAHFLAHDSGLHQLVSHWLRTHACTEPYIIATRRQLSEMHPIFRLLHPHFRYTMEINALARAYLINAHGIIEGAFTPLKYSMELCSVAYKEHWRFDQQSLPADLISRGMAEPDYREPHGLKLAIKDYPYANDGLMLWDILKKWVTDYVTHYYEDDESVKSDEELQAWWTEIRTVGHADKKDEPWWPVLNTPADLIGILTTIVWVTSGMHAAVNFGQYDFAGYFPNRPTIARTTMPTEDPTDERWELFLRRPEVELLKCFPSQTQATIIMAILHILSTHSPDEDYIGENMEPAWEKDPVIRAAFLEFSGRLKELEGIIDARNSDEKLSNRTGAGVVPYQLLKPFSEPGCTAQGIPYSISI